MAHFLNTSRALTISLSLLKKESYELLFIQLTERYFRKISVSEFNIVLDIIVSVYI